MEGKPTIRQARDYPALGLFQLGASPDGDVTADLRGDMKWPEYLDYCDRYYWAVPDVFDHELLDDLHFMPHRAGLIVADRFDAAVVRDAAVVPLNAARRKAEVEMRKMRAMQPVGGDQFQLGSRQIMIDAPGRRLDRDAERGFGRD